MRHNGIRDLEGELMREVCKDVKIEPELQPVGEREMSGITTDKARLDVSGVGVWGTHERTFLDIKVFHPNCASYINMSLEDAYVHHENIKKRNYRERVLNVEHGSLTPIVFSTAGGASPEANKHHKRIAQLIALKRNLLRSILIAIRGERGRSSRANPISTIEFGMVPSSKD